MIWSDSEPSRSRRRLAISVVIWSCSLRMSEAEGVGFEGREVVGPGAVADGTGAAERILPYEVSITGG